MFRAFHQVRWVHRFILYALVTSVGKTTTTRNTTQGPSRGFRDNHQGEKNIQQVPQVTSREVSQLYGHGCSNAAGAECPTQGFNELPDILHSARGQRERNAESTATTAYRAYNGYRAPRRFRQVGRSFSRVPPGHGEVGLWLADESKRAGSRAIMNEQSNRYTL